MGSSSLPLTSALVGVGGQRHAPGRFTSGKDPVPIVQEAGWATGPIWKDPVPVVQEAGWATGPVWTGAENLALTGIRSPDHPS